MPNTASCLNISICSHFQVADSRHLPADSHNLTYSSASFLDSLTRSFYSQDLTSKPMSVPPFSGHPVGRPEEILGLDNRQHPIQKPDPYYGIHKSMYITGGAEVGDTYTPNQYGLNKLLSPQQGTYFQQPASSQPQVHYGIDKLTATPLNYYNQPNNTDKSSIEPRDTVPKQTLHYGPSVQPVSTPNHSHYQQSIPRSDQQHLSNPSQHKVPNSSEQLQVYHSGIASPHLTYSQVYKGSQPQTQVNLHIFYELYEINFLILTTFSNSAIQNLHIYAMHKISHSNLLNLYYVCFFAIKLCYFKVQCHWNMCFLNKSLFLIDSEQFYQ